MLKKMLQTNDGWAMLLVRLPLGVDMLVHGWAKVTNVPGTMSYFDGLDRKSTRLNSSH